MAEVIRCYGSIQRCVFSTNLHALRGKKVDFDLLPLIYHVRLANIPNFLSFLLSFLHICLHHYLILLVFLYCGFVRKFYTGKKK